MPAPRLRLPLLPLAICLPAFLGSGCGVAPPTPEDWLAVGFRTPEETFRTFQTALRAEQPGLEYRCLSEDFKAAEGLNQIAYREFRGRLFDEQPELKRVACAKVIEVRELAPNRRRLVAHVSAFFVERTFSIDFVREEFYELAAEEALLDDGFLDFDRTVRPGAGDTLVVSLAPTVLVFPEELTEVRIGREWKIDAFPELVEP